MRTPIRITAVAVACLLLIGCARAVAPWTPAPPEPGASASPTPVASAATPAASPGATPAPMTDNVLPALTPKAELQPVPAGEVNVAYAPNVPPATTRTQQAIVEVHFDVVEGVQAIDPNGTEYETWGYRLHGDDSVTSGTPGPIIRARVGDIFRFTLTNPAATRCPTTSTFTP